MNKEQSDKEVDSKNRDLRLSASINQIIEICEKIPQTYRNSCFEILLKAKLQESDKRSSQKTVSPQAEDPPQKMNTTFEVSIDVRAFLSQFNLDESIIQELFIIDDQQIRPKFTISTTAKSKAQLQIALLLALENAIKNPQNMFEFSSEDVRTRCKDRTVIDSHNFKAHFKNNKKFFKSLTDFEKISLSPDGKSELADVISQIVNEQKKSN